MMYDVLMGYKILYLRGAIFSMRPLDGTLLMLETTRPIDNLFGLETWGEDIARRSEQLKNYAEK